MIALCPLSGGQAEVLDVANWPFVAIQIQTEALRSVGFHQQSSGRPFAEHTATARRKGRLKQPSPTALSSARQHFVRDFPCSRNFARAQVMGGLQVERKLRSGVEVTDQVQCRIDADAAALPHDVIDVGDGS